MVGKSYAIVPEGEQPASGGPPMPSKPPSFIHELVLAMVRTIFRDEIAKVLPVTGTVTALSGTNLLVKRDQDTTSLLIPHVAGRRWPNGTRVILIPGSRGEYVCIGGMTTALGVSEAVVSTPDIADTAITLAKLAGDVQTRLANVERVAADAAATATNAVAAIGVNGGSTAASTGLWQGIYGDADAASAAHGLASDAFNRATVAQSGADVASLGVVNILNGTSTIPGVSAARDAASNANTRVTTLNTRYNAHTAHPPQQGGLG